MPEEVLNEMQPETPQPEVQPSAGGKALSAVKEWFRKKVVALKVKPQIIPLIVLALTTVCFMLFLYKFSGSIAASFNDARTKATGICIFISTLLSLLVLVSFLNAFPKRKKPNIFFIVLVFAMLAGILACDIVYYVQMENCIEFNGVGSSLSLKVEPGQPYMIAHIVLLCVSAVVFALLPVYGRLIKKINTSKKLESAAETMSGGIDIEEE